MPQLLIIEQTENLYTVCHIEGTRASDVRRLVDHARNAMYGMDDPPEEHDPGNDPINACSETWPDRPNEASD